MTRKIFQILVPLSMSFFWIRYLDKILNSFHAKFWWTYQSYIEVRSGKLFFYSKSYKTKNRKESVPGAHNQSCKHINASTFFGGNRLLNLILFFFPYWKLTRMWLLMQEQLRHPEPYEKEWDTQLSYSSTKRVCQKFHFEGLEASLNKLHCAT